MKNWELRIKNSRPRATIQGSRYEFSILNSEFFIAVLRLAVIAAVCFGAASSAYAQKYSNVGRAKCVNCHDHDREKLWSEKKDGPPPNNHVNALKQMDTPKSKDFAKAVGVADVYDPASSSCLKCHATVVKGDVGGGITCESCHGPGSGYLDPHQKKDAYAAAVATGMTDAVKKPQAWAALCMNCHVMDDARLIAAKHPSGDDFDLGAKFQVVATDHWKNSYDKAQIATLGKAELQKIVAKRKGGAVTTAAAAPAATAAPAAAAAAPPAAPPPPAAPAPPAPPPATATGAPAAATPAPPPAAAPAVPPPAASAPAAARTPAAAAPAATPTARPSPAPARPAPAARSAPAPAAVPPPGLPPPAPAAPPPPPAEVSSDMMNAVSSLAAALPTSPAAAVAAVQGRAIALIDALLRRGGRAPVRVTPPEQKADYKGPDADLLRLQDDVLSLAIEALRTAPPAPNTAGKP
jgi:hypothetical protein